MLSLQEVDGAVALHEMLNKLDPTRSRWGLRRVPTYTGDYLWLCDEHYKQAQSKIPEKWETS